MKAALYKIDVNGIISVFLPGSQITEDSFADGTARTSVEFGGTKSLFHHDGKLFISSEGCHVFVVDLATDTISIVAGSVCEWSISFSSDDTSQFEGSGSDMKATAAIVANPQITGILWQKRCFPTFKIFSLQSTPLATCFCTSASLP